MRIPGEKNWPILMILVEVAEIKIHQLWNFLKW